MSFGAEIMQGNLTLISAETGFPFADEIVLSAGDGNGSKEYPDLYGLQLSVIRYRTSNSVAAVAHSLVVDYNLGYPRISWFRPGGSVTGTANLVVAR